MQTGNVSADCANVTEATNKRTQAFNSSENTERRESVRAFPDAESYTSDYLYENDELRAQVLQDCKENEQSQDNCNNAHSAESKKFSETSEDKNVQQW